MPLPSSLLVKYQMRLDQQLPTPLLWVKVLDLQRKM
jgi:hypothetical protein